MIFIWFLYKESFICNIFSVFCLMYIHICVCICSGLLFAFCYESHPSCYFDCVYIGVSEGGIVLEISRLREGVYGGSLLTS